MKVLELFCGTKSISKAFESRGHITHTIDNNPLHNPDWIGDILNLEVSSRTLDSFNYFFDVIWASPPCTTFSVASIGTHWTGHYSPKTVECALGMAYVLKTLEIIRLLKPKYWFIENPVGVLRKMGFIEHQHRKTLNYCQYGDSRMKPTDIWTNQIGWIPRERCKNGDKCHESAPRGSKTGTQGLKNSVDRSRIPLELCNEIVDICEGKLMIEQKTL